MPITDSARRTLELLIAQARNKPVLMLTGAGISAESGIPTFRGPEGYWTVGAHEYHPQDLATFEAFQRMPEEIWAWYLYRRAVCRAAQPNEAHRALVELERSLVDRFRLITQNVDGLHLLAGNSRERTWQIHGNIQFMRCARECSSQLTEIPPALDQWTRTRKLTPAEREFLKCASCGSMLRPHVLWFDESYDEPFYRWESSLRAAQEAGLLVVIGTSGATNLPDRIVRTVAARNQSFVVINLDESPFSALADQSPHGLTLRGTAGEMLPIVTTELLRPQAV